MPEPQFLFGDHTPAPLSPVLKTYSSPSSSLPAATCSGSGETIDAAPFTAAVPIGASLVSSLAASPIWARRLASLGSPNTAAISVESHPGQCDGSGGGGSGRGAFTPPLPPASPLLSLAPRSGAVREPAPRTPAPRGCADSEGGCMLRPMRSPARDGLALVPSSRQSAPMVCTAHCQCLPLARFTWSIRQCIGFSSTHPSSPVSRITTVANIPMSGRSSGLGGPPALVAAAWPLRCCCCMRRCCRCCSAPVPSLTSLSESNTPHE
jgi:hypothetical protein